MRKRNGMDGTVFWVWTCLGLSMTLGWAQSPANLPAEVIAYADLVFYNGKILTADEEFTIVEAVAVRDGKFLARGDNDRILAMAGPRTRRVDLEGRILVPGFIDTHQHASFVTSPPSSRGGGFEENNFDTLESALETLKAKIQEAEPGEFIAVSSTSNKVVTQELNAALLDQVSPENPFYVRGLNNQVVANSLVLKHVPPDTPGILRDDQGRPTGQLRGGAGGIVVYEIRPWPEVEALLEPQKDSFLRHNRMGLTTLMGRAGGLEVSVFRDLMTRNELTMRVRVAHHFLRQNGFAEAYLKRLGNLTDVGNDMFKIIGTSVQVVGRHFAIDHGLMWKPEHYEKLKEMDVIPSVYAKALYSNDNLVEMYGMDAVYKMQPV